jgi:BON domain
MVAFIVFFAVVAAEQAPTLESPHRFPVTNPTELLEGSALRTSPDPFRKYIELKQPVSGVFQEPYGPVGTPRWFGQILGLLTRQQIRIELSNVKPIHDAEAPDQDIAMSLITKLNDAKDSGKLKGFSIDFKVETDGTVWLSGRVSNKEQKDLVLGIASRIKGVKKVIDDLTIAEAPKSSP